jgi:uncharacterized membrane protein YphA (DoxX/SURF4 family)
MSAANPELAAASVEASPTSVSWSPTHRVLFRFGFVYWMLFCGPMLMTEVPGADWLGGLYLRGWSKWVVWVGKHVLGIGREISLRETGSGDTTYGWVSLFSIAALAVVAAAIWSIADRERVEYVRLRALLRIVIRYMLGFVMLGYGVIKLFGGQFPPPPLGRLLQSYGESSPMGLLWTFMGASPAYVRFSGAGETLGALLVLFRRTTTLGALVLAAVLTNVVMLNFAYDVPVKIHSSHYLAMCVFLLLPDLRRLADVLLFNRPTQPVDQSLHLPKRWMRIARPIAKLVIVGVALVQTVRFGWSGRASDDGPKSDLDGYWDVESFVRNGQDVPPVLTDKTRWRRLKLESDEGKLYVRWHLMDRSYGYGPLFSVRVDDAKHAMTLTGEEQPKQETLVLSFVRADRDHFTIEGTIGQDKLAVRVARFEPGKMLLLSRGFHWISEEPFNR